MTIQPEAPGAIELASDQIIEDNTFANIGLEEEPTQSAGVTSTPIRFYRTTRNAPAWYEPGFYTSKNYKRALERTFTPTAPRQTFMEELAEWSVANRLNDLARQGKDPGTYARELLAENPNMTPSLLAAAVTSLVPLNSDIVDLDAQTGDRSMVRAKAESAASDALLGVERDTTTKVWRTPDGKSREIGPTDYLKVAPDGTTIGAFNQAGQPLDPNSLAAVDETPSGLYKGFKWLSRNVFAAAQLPIEGITGAVRGVVGADSAGEKAQYLADLLIVPSIIEELTGNGDDRQNAWEQTTMGQTIVQAVERATNGDGSLAVDQGNGFFVNPESQVGQGQRQAAYDTATVNGEAWTFGRGAATAIGLDPDTTSYRFVSGLVDTGIALAADPVNYVPMGFAAKSIGKVTGGKVLVGEALRKKAFAESALLANAEEVRRLKDDVIPDLQMKVARGEARKEELDAVMADVSSREELLGRMQRDVDELSALDEALQTSEYVNAQQRARMEADALRRAQEGAAELPALVAERLRMKGELELRADVGLARNGVDETTVEQLRPLLAGLMDQYPEPQALVDELQRLEGLPSFGLRTEQPIGRDGVLPGLFDDGVEVVARWSGDGDPTMLNGMARPSQSFMNGLLDALRKEVIPGSEKEAAKIRASLESRRLRLGEDPTATQQAVVRATIPGRAEAFDTADGMRFYITKDGQYVPSQGARLGNTAFLSETEAAAVQAAIDAGVPYLTKGGNLVGRQYVRGEGFNPRAYGAHIKNGKTREEAFRLAGGTVKRVTIRPKSDPRQGLVPFEWGDKGQRLGQTIASMSDSLPTYRQAANEALAEATNLSGKIINDIAPENIKTIRDVLNALDANGLGPWFSRYLQQQGIDGVANLTGRGRGFWYGFNGKADAYGARLSDMASGSMKPVKELNPGEQFPIPGAANLILDVTDGVQAEIGQLNAYIRQIDSEVIKITSQVSGRQVRSANADAAVARLQAARQQALDQLNAIENSARPLTMTDAEARVKALPGLRDALAYKQRELQNIYQRHGRGIQRYDRLLTFLEKQHAALDDNTRILNALEESAGLRRGPNGNSLDQSALLSFVLGGSGRLSKIGKMALVGLTQITDTAQLRKITQGKWETETLIALTKNAAREDLDEAGKMQGVYDILARQTGVKITDRAGYGVASELAKVAGYSPAMAKVNRKVMKVTDKWQRLVPGTLSADLRDVDDVIKKVEWYFRTAGDDVFSPERQDEIIRRLIATADPDNYRTMAQREGQEAARRNAVIDMFKAMTMEYAEKVARESGKNVAEARADLDGAFRAFANSLQDQQKYWQNRVAKESRNGEAPYILDGSGNPIQLPSAHIIAEFSNNVMPMPSPDAFTKAVKGILGTKIHHTKATEWIDEAFSDYWRSLILMRPAYIVRNVMEMNIRTFLSGHRSFLKNPLSMAALSMGSKDGRLMSRVMNRLNKFENDVLGNDFVTKIGDEDELNDLMRYYVQMVRSNAGLTDIRVGAKARRVGFMPIAPDHPQFAAGWADELMLLRADPIARMVAGGLPVKWQKEVASGAMTQQDATIAAIMTDDKILDFLQGGGPTFQRFMSDPVALRNWVFDDENFSIARRVEMFTAGNDNLKQFVATGVLRNKRGEEVLAGIRREALDKDLHSDKRTQILSKALKQFRPEIDDAALSRMEIRDAPLNVAQGAFTKVADAFFKVSARMERLSTMGPEFRQQYWDEIAELAPFMSPDAKAAALKAAPESLYGLKAGGVNIGRKHPALAALRGKQAGGISLEEANRIAWGRAQNHVRDLFYDASDRQAGWHALRLLMPFGQAWANSMGVVTQLAAKNPVQVYRFMRALNGLGGAQVTQALGFEQDDEAGWFNESEGLIQTDDFGQKFILIPGLGETMSFMTNAIAKTQGIEDPNVDQKAGWNLQNLNLIFGGTTPLPGLGPVGVMGAQAVRGIMPGWDEFSDEGSAFEKVLNEWAFPYDDLNARTALESLMPTWLSRAVGATTSDEFNRWNATNVKPAMSWLINNRSYDLKSPAGQEQLSRDSGVLARVLTGMTALASFMGPTSPNTQRLLRDADGDAVGAATLSNLFYQEFLPGAEGDFTVAYANFLDKYGPEFLTTVSGTREGSFRTSDKGWQKAAEYPDSWKSSPEEFSLLFPGSRTSIAASRWVRNEGISRDLSLEERTTAFTRILYDAELGRIEAAAERQGWTDEQMAMARQDLKQTYGPVADDVAPQIGSGAGVRIEAMKGWLDDHPELAQEPSVQAFYAAYAIRTQATARAKTLGVGGMSGGLSSKSARPLRMAYQVRLAQLDEQYANAGLVLDLFDREWEAE